MKYLAHTKDGKTFINESECQELKEHLEKTAAYAKEKAESFGASEATELIGLLHDIGKYSSDFQKRIRGESKSPAPHAMTGARMITDKYDALAEYYGIVIGSHHTGLSNWGTKADRDNITYCGKLNNYEEKELIFDEELSLPANINHKLLKPQKNCEAFQVATYLRMLFSVLVDSDFTDTEEFCKDVKRKGVDFEINKLLACLKNKPEKSDGEVNKIRNEILAGCLSATENPQGLFSLTIPTGGGKTLSSLAFALKHAAKHGLRRIIYVIPYTSIIEQNANVLREKLGAENVLEHHSGIDIDDTDFRARWATENWDVPIIVTTNVQFFESLFSNKTSKSRKIHNIAKSVVIFDEVQMLPLDYITPCMSIISELVENYGVTAVLCSATQPCVQKYTYDNIKTVEIAKNPENLSERLRRVNFRFAGEKSDDVLVNELTSLTSALIVVNSRKHAFNLYNSAKEIITDDSLFYLSTLFTPADRSMKIDKIKERLKKNLPVKVISTQLIEAGVDIDFPVVYRSIAGIDSIIQAGGRANREGKLKNPDGSPTLGEVVIFKPIGDGVLPKSLEIYASKAREVIACFGDNAFGLMGIRKYFELLYHNLERDGLMDKKGVMSEFEMDMRKGEIVKMNFETVAEKFKLIDNNTYGIIIPNSEITDLINSLRSGDYSKSMLRKLQRHTVSVYDKEYKQLQADSALEIINGINILITEKYYSEEKGLDIFTNENKNAEALFM